MRALAAADDRLALFLIPYHGSDYQPHDYKQYYRSNDGPYHAITYFSSIKLSTAELCVYLKCLCPLSRLSYEQPDRCKYNKYRYDLEYDLHSAYIACHKAS